MPLAIALGPLLILGAASFLYLGSYALVPLALGGIAAAFFGAREGADKTEGAVGLLAGLVVWLPAVLIVAVLFVEFE